MSNHYDVLIVGGGVMGLSVAWEMSRRGRSVVVLERDQPGRGASWAGAGMIPPGAAAGTQTATPQEQLAGRSAQLHVVWHEELLERTGIDNGYRPHGALYLQPDSDNDNDNDLARQVSHWEQIGVETSWLDATEIAEIEPHIRSDQPAVHVPGEAQIRNPRHLNALLHACAMSGVVVLGQHEVQQIDWAEDCLERVWTIKGSMTADQYCLTAGAWSGQIAERAGLSLPVRPMRGQMALLKGEPGLLKRIVNVGPRYLVPRDDGHILVGSTVEAVDFECETTEAGIGGLLDFATSVAPALGSLPLVGSWAGLRPTSATGLPLMGRLPGVNNLWVATGHYRAGLQLSPASAELMSDLMCGQEPRVSAEAFAIGSESGSNESTVQGFSCEL